MGFRKDLAFGNDYEMLFVEKYHSDGNKIDMPKGCFKLYDVCVDGVKYEVKADRQTHKTRNIAIEYECSGKGSGITTTTADFYAYFIVIPNGMYHLYMIPTFILRKYISEEKYFRIVSGGDGWRSKMYLFNISVFERYLVDTS